MIVVYCFIGKLPEYAIDTVYQTRLFYKGPIYFIIDDYESDIINLLKINYNVTIIKYNDVLHREFNECVKEYYHRFCIADRLKGREKLFIYSFERFFVLYELMVKENLSDVFFMELDNLIYDNPENWLDSFLNKDIAYMYDNVDRSSSGICYIKNTSILSHFTNYCINFIKTTTKFVSEMNALYDYWQENRELIQFLPTHWPSQNVPYETYMNYDKYNESIFDSAGLGVYLGGMDPYHTDGIIKLKLKAPWSAINYTNYEYKWEINEIGRKIPYVLNNGKWIKINNLHVHSKDLKSCLSI